MAFTNSTTHYGLPQWIGTDKPTYLVDQNNAYATIDTQLYNASTDAASAVATANSAATSATTAAENAATALSTANTADGKADSAITQSELAQTAAGAAQVAATAAQEAAAGNSITNLAPAYDSTLTYNVGDLVTAQGKLYKCIVTVSTPMDFDINYWDDITVSEAIGEGSGVDSRLDALESDMTTAQGNITSLGTRLTTAESNISTAQGNITSIGTRLTTAESDIDTLQNTKYIAVTTANTVHSSTSNYTIPSDGLYLVSAWGAQADVAVYCKLNSITIASGNGLATCTLPLKAGAVVSFSGATGALIDSLT